MGVINLDERVTKLEQSVNDDLAGTVDEMSSTLTSLDEQINGTTLAPGGLARTVDNLDTELNGSVEHPGGLISEVEIIVEQLNSTLENEGQYPPGKQIYLSSSTAASEKVFMITVNDSGTISATEVTT